VRSVRHGAVPGVNLFRKVAVEDRLVLKLVTTMAPDELAKILGHSNIKMTERYAKLARKHIARTSSTAREIWKQLEGSADKANVG
jgi:hypothetical protein